MKKSKFFCPPEHLVAASNEIEIIGVGDVTIEDAYHRVISGSFGIYAYEVDPETNVRTPVYIYPQSIKTNVEEGANALKSLETLLSAAMNNPTEVPIGLKGKYLSAAKRTLDYLILLPDLPSETCTINESKWNFESNVLAVDADTAAPI